MTQVCAEIRTEVASHTSAYDVFRPGQEGIMNMNSFAISDPSNFKNIVDGDLYLIPIFIAALCE